MNFKNAYIAFIPSRFVEEYLLSADFSPPGDYDSIILEVLIGFVFFLPLQSETEPMSCRNRHMSSIKNSSSNCRACITSRELIYHESFYARLGNSERAPVTTLHVSFTPWADSRLRHLILQHSLHLFIYNIFRLTEIKAWGKKRLSNCSKVC